MAFSRSLIPSMFSRSWWDLMDYPSSTMWDHPVSGMFGSNLLPPTTPYGLLSKTLANMCSPSQSSVKNEKDNFHVMLNVKHFKPDEVEVKVVDNCVVVHGKHEEKTDEHGFIQREFTRRYVLPDGIEVETVKSTWSRNGILTIEASKKAIEPPPTNERVIPIAIQPNESVEDKK